MLGMADVPQELLSQGEEKLGVYKYLIGSMTKEEKQDPSLLKGSRADRVVKGSGRSYEELRDLLKHYEATKKMVNLFRKGRDRKLLGLAKRLEGLNLKGLM